MARGLQVPLVVLNPLEWRRLSSGQVVPISGVIIDGVPRRIELQLDASEQIDPPQAREFLPVNARKGRP
jgi:hypothetical protein